MVSLLDQLHAFAMTALGGVLMGVLFDCLRVVRAVVGRRAPFAWVLDLLYWIVLTPLMAGLLLQANWGELRFYVLLGIGTGLALYFAFGSGLVLETLLAVSRGMMALLAWVAHVLRGLLMLPAMLLRTAAYTVGANRWEGGRRSTPSGLGMRRLWSGLSWLRWPWRSGLAWRRR